MWAPSPVTPPLPGTEAMGGCGLSLRQFSGSSLEVAHVTPTGHIPSARTCPPALLLREAEIRDFAMCPG